MTPTTAVGVRGSVRRILSLARAETVLLWRSPMALLNALVAPLALLILANVLPQGEPMPQASVITMLTGSVLLFVVYYNLVTTLVARREELVLKRLRSGESSDAEILLGASTPALVIAWGQILTGIIAGVVVFGMAMPANPGLVLLAVLSGTGVFVLLAAASTAMTRTVEMAQLATLPVVVVSMFFGGLFPVGMLPGPAQWLAEVLPLSRVIDLLWLGLTGVTQNGRTIGGWESVREVGSALLVIAAWVFVGFWAVRRFMRWEPRR